MADAIPYDPFPVFVMFYLRQYVDIKNHPDPFQQFIRTSQLTAGNGHQNGHYLPDQRRMQELHYCHQGRR